MKDTLWWYFVAGATAALIADVWMYGDAISWMH